MIKFIKYLVQSIFIYLFFIIGRLIGLDLSRKIFSKIFLSFGSLFRSNKIIKKNLEIFSQNISETRKNEIISNMWRNYGMTFIEYAFLNYFRKNNHHIELKGLDVLENIIKRKKPAIFISGHFANFELMSMEITKKNIQLATIYRPLNNYFLNPLMEFLRKKYVCKNQIKKGMNGVREAIEHLNSDCSIALMIDQRVSEGEPINFFDKPALTTTLHAQLALKFDIPIVPVFISRSPKNNFFIEFQDEIYPTGFKNKLELSEKCNQILEKMILKKPDQWIWTHNRWK
tara:strand:- start:470 stop:1327 length:858 start_codon:yes stop_codon:yes gene_type:complete